MISASEAGPSRGASTTPLTVTVRHDEAAQVWYVEGSELPGLHAEAASLDELVAIIEDLAPDLAAANLPPDRTA